VGDLDVDEVLLVHAVGKDTLSDTCYAPSGLQFRLDVPGSVARTGL
jgi:hypothetical protein